MTILSYPEILMTNPKRTNAMAKKNPRTIAISTLTNFLVCRNQEMVLYSNEKNQMITVKNLSFVSKNLIFFLEFQINNFEFVS